MKRIDILREANRLLEKGYSPSICKAIDRALDNNYISTFSKYELFPLFNPRNAIRFSTRLMFNREYRFFGEYWWEPYNYKRGRKRFMKWLMKQYENDKEEIQ